LVVIAGRHFYNTGDLADNKRSPYLLPGKKLSYCQGAVEPVVHHWSLWLYEFAEFHETFGTVRRAVKQTVRLYHRRRPEIYRRRRLCSPLRRWYLRCLLIGFSPFL